MASRRDFILAALTGSLGALVAQGDEPKKQDPVAAELHERMMGDETVAMLLYDRFTALDLFGPHHILASMMGAKVHFVAKTLDPVTTDLGIKITPTITMDECPEDLTILFIPGGTQGTLAAAEDPKTRSFVASRGAKAEWVTSVCTGSVILGAAGLLKGYKATTHWLAMGALESFGATPVKERVVIDRNRVTGAGVTAGLDFGLTLVGKLRNDAYAQAVQLMSEYDPNPPFHSGSPDKAPPAIVKMLQTMQGPFETRAKAIAERLAKETS